jgi:hypothetical protein
VPPRAACLACPPMPGEGERLSKRSSRGALDAQRDMPPSPHDSAAVSRTSGSYFAICSNRSAAPLGFRRPTSQLASVTTGTFGNRAKHGLLSFSFHRMSQTSWGRIRFICAGRTTVVVRIVILREPVT